MRTCWPARSPVDRPAQTVVAYPTGERQVSKLASVQVPQLSAAEAELGASKAVRRGLHAGPSSDGRDDLLGRLRLRAGHGSRCGLTRLPPVTSAFLPARGSLLFMTLRSEVDMRALVDRALIARETDRVDRRRRVLHLTRKGDRLARKLESTNAATEDALLERLGPTEYRSLREKLIPIIEADN